MSTGRNLKCGNFIFHKVLCFLIGLNIILCICPFTAKALDEKPDTPPKIETPKEKTAEGLFQEAQAISEKYPDGAIQLLIECLALKPDTWQARKQLASLYEKQNKWGLAITEYEAVNTASESAEGFSDIVRVMEKGGFLRNAAKTDMKAFEKYPDKPEFLLQAGEIFLKSGADNDAAASLQEFIKQRPDEGKAYLLLANIHEKAGRLPDALRMYMRAHTLMKENRDAADAIKRLTAKTFQAENIWIFLPVGWVAEKDGMTNLQWNQRMTLNVSAGGDTETIALKAAREAMPEALFSDENLKSFEKMRVMREEIEKSNPEAAKMMQSIPLPFFSSKDFNGIAGASMVLLSTSETPQPGIESVCAAAMTKDGKIYSFVLKSNGPVAEGEKTLTDILSQVIWSP